MVNPAHTDQYDAQAALDNHLLTKWLDRRGWTYHPHQLDVLDKAQAGKDVLLFAPTGAGKTLSGFLPSIMDLVPPVIPSEFCESASKAGEAEGSHTTKGDSSDRAKALSRNDRNTLHTLYISPLKALAVDVHRNLMAPIEEMGIPITVETRTGDTPASKRQRQKTRPPQMLMTTPESLALLTSYADSATYFSDLKFIVIDELHALMHSKRGDLLSLNLARLHDFAPGAQRIGLSATIPDQKTAAAYLFRPAVIPSDLSAEALAQAEVEGSQATDGDSSTRAKALGRNDTEMGSIVAVPNDVKPEIEILLGESRIPWSGHMATFAIPQVYERIKNAKMSVVFVNTRAQAELMFQNLWKVNEQNLRIAVHHGSLEKDLRRKVEDQMAKGNLDCVVATASLDLGLDWANVDLVVQIGAPKGVSRLLQRIGRSNHRMDEPSKALLVPANRFEYLECLAAKDAISDGDLDGVHPKNGGLDVLAQHITGMACNGPFRAVDAYNSAIKAWPYRNLDRATFDRVLMFVQNGGYALQSYDRYARLIEKDGIYSIAHKRFIQQYRMNIGTIVESHLLKVKLGQKTLGKIEEWFVQGLSPGDTFMFGGTVLKYESLSDQGIQVRRTKDANPRIPSYAGGRMPLSTALSFRVRKMLNGQKQWEQYPDQVRDWLALHKDRSVMPPEDGLLVETFQRGVKRNKRNYLVAYTFEGRNAHQTLGFLLSRRMQRFGYKPLGFVATDYAMALWTMNPVERVDHLFHQDLMLDDLHEWLADTPLLKRNFRDVAVIAGLIERRYPGQQKTGKQVTFNSDLIYDVLRKYEPDHILLQAAQDDALVGLIDLQRLGDMLVRVQGKIVHKKLDRVSPLAVPLILEISKETINRKELGEYYLEEFEAELLEEAGLT